jgi:hypothetical protein
MSYRGEDLDLRTPQGRQSRDQYGADHGMNGARPRNPGTSNGRGDQLYVDETVLAGCNHAYDVAHAHGAAEVRLEHLVHALTRVEAAAEILEQRGIREAHLRRESAAVIASEIPVGLAHSHAAPRASVEFEDVLRRASDQGRSRGAAASVHDLLWVLLNYNREIPAIALLLRHARDWQTWDWPHKVETRREEFREPRYTERRVYTETIAPPPPRQRVVERVIEEAAPQVVERVVHEAAPASVVYSQQVNLDPVHARLDHMEQSLRKIQGDMANDRRQLADEMRDMMRESMRDMAREVQREISAMPRTSGGMPAGMVERFEQAERSLEARAQDFGRTSTTLTERLQTLERSVNAGMQEGARNWAALGERMKTLQAHGNGNGADVSGMFSEHLGAVTSQVQAATEKLQALERIFETKLRSLDEGVTASRRDGTGVAQLINERFQTVRQQLEQQNLATASLVAQMTEPVTERLRQLETGLQRQVESLASRPGDPGLGDRLERAINERIGRVEQAMAGIQQASSQSYQLTSQVGERMRAMETSATVQPQAIQGVVQGLAAKMTHIEQLVQSHGDRAVQYTQQVAQQAADAHTRELTDLQEALVKLGTNQQSLSETLDQWRTENEGGLSILSNRLEVLETASAQPMQMLKQMQGDIHGLQRVTIADYDQNRRGIRHWLFGTEEIFAGSWRDETRQIRERLSQARDERAEQRKV